MKAFASNENLVLDYRASAHLTRLFPAGSWEKTEGWVYFSPETVGRKKLHSLVRLRLYLSQTNDVTEACNVSVFSGQREAEKLVTVLIVYVLV